MKNHERRRCAGKNPVSLILAAALAVSAVFALSACGGDKSEAVARVGDTTITENQLSVYTEFMVMAQGGDFDTFTDDAARMDAKLSILDIMVEMEVARLYLNDKDAMPDDFEEQLKSFVDSMNSNAEYKDMFKKKGITDDTLRYFAESQFLQQALVDEVSENMPQPTEAEVREYYDANADSLMSAGEQRAVSHILVGSEDHTPEDRQLIEEIREKIVSGNESFEDMAKEYSIDSSNKDNGGAMAPVEKGTFVPEFDDVAFSLGENIVSDVIETKFGFHILKVDKILPAGELPSLDEAREGIIQTLNQSKTYDLFVNRIDELVAEADIEYLTESYPAPGDRDPGAGAGSEGENVGNEDQNR